ncbi:hypothetical protein J8F10_09205 [Gemmata sp. G18]|uniref:Uncharacterized protein n=1 Tax=Gemmata palustris TaxID=2822762 RepID=A0ABS5BP16_9BACT|nr:hypothetical protein [Gemmata palustris]MBP3955458.1 hypothetical protein [Gemmata palustris]
MTAVLNPPLLERVKAALHVYVARGDRINAAQAAIDACHAEQMRQMLEKVTRQLKAVEPRYSRDKAVIAEAEALLAKLDGQP